MRTVTDSTDSPQARTEDKPHSLFDVVPNELVREVIRFVGIEHSSYVNRGKDYNCVRFANRRLNELWKEVNLEAFKLDVLSQKFEEADKEERYFASDEIVKVCNSIAVGIVNYNLEDLFDFAVQKMDEHLWGRICVKAIRWGRLTLLKRIFVVLEEGNLDYAEKYGGLFTIAVECGNLEILKYLREQGFAWGPLSLKLAVMAGDLNIVKFIYQEGGVLTYSLYKRAVSSKNEEMIQFLREHNCPTDNSNEELACRNYLLKQRGLGNLCINMRNCWSHWRE